MLQVNYLESRGVANGVPIMYFEFIFDNSSELPISIYTAGTSKYIIANESIAVSRKDDSWYKYVNDNWSKQKTEKPELTNTTTITSNGNTNIADNFTKGFRSINVNVDDGTYNYEELNNKPSINNVELIGNKTSDDLNLVGAKSEGTDAEIFNDYEKNIAIGDYSTARGTKTTAYGTASYAEGYSQKSQQDVVDVRTLTPYQIAYNFEYGNSSDRTTVAYGVGSHSEGNTTLAVGEYAHSEGQFTLAYGERSHAEGTTGLAKGNSSHTEGIGCSALNDSAHGEGNSTTAYGKYSHAEGYAEYPIAFNFPNWNMLNQTKTKNEILSMYKQHTFNMAYGLGSHTEGYETLALGTTAHAEGYGTIAYGDASHAEGIDTTAYGNYSHIEGRSTNSANSKISNLPTATIDDIQTTWQSSKFSLAYGIGSHVEGKDCLVLLENSHAEGQNNIIEKSGSCAHVEGQNNKVSGFCSHAEGNNNEALDYCNHAEGAYTKCRNVYTHTEGMYSIADGTFSHAEGFGSDVTIDRQPSKTNAINKYKNNQFHMALGQASHIEGYNNLALDQYTHIQGYCNVASTSYQTVMGMYNNYETVTDSQAKGKYAFMIGNGTDNTHRSNAFAVDWDGNIYLNVKINNTNTFVKLTLNNDQNHTVTWEVVQ